MPSDISSSSTAPTRLHLHDTLSGQSRPLVPMGAQYTLYCCGPTVYGPAHIGNFRTFVTQDTLRRVLEAQGTPTLHVRNLTDVDDKTLRQSQLEGKTLLEFTRYWTERFWHDCQQLNLLTPHLEPKATEHIAEQIELIAQLIARGLAYPSTDGSVYYKVQAFAPYGRLCGLTQPEALRSHSPGTADEYTREHVCDFALWKRHKPEDGPTAWDSPWGKGRPGWHIECSAMAMKYLGPTLDLHAGGIDLCFPHHENEIAQSEGATGQCFARHWMHTAHLMVEGQKMSKSLGNLYTLADLQAKGYSALAVRYALLAGHYRQGLNFTLEALKGAETALEKLFYALQHQRHALASCVTPSPGPHAWGPLHGAWAALCDDLNVPGALGVLFGTLAQHPAYDPARDPSPQAHWALVRDTEALLQLLGLEAVAAHTEPPPAVLQAAQARWAAKQARDFAAADTARQTLKALGWTVLDQREGYMLLPANMPWRTPNA